MVFSSCISSMLRGNGRLRSLMRASMPSASVGALVILYRWAFSVARIHDDRSSAFLRRLLRVRSSRSLSVSLSFPFSFRPHSLPSARGRRLARVRA